jgi:superfamily II DNA or RNA helicase
MHTWLDRYRQQGEHALEAGHVLYIEFSGPTYQIEVYDPSERASVWSFLQFDEKGELKDAFCSCPAGEEGCGHLAAAYLKIYGIHRKPLHLRFASSFWNQLCCLIGDHIGYDERFLQKIGEGHYLYNNYDVQFELLAKTEGTQKRLSQLIDLRPRETPETSIKFSNISQDEIAHWREGRPGPALRYALSFWFDLAQWMMNLADAGSLVFQDDEEGYPTHILTTFSQFTASFTLKKSDLPYLIPLLDTVNSPLRVMHISQKQVEKITFNPQERAFCITHAALAFPTQDYPQARRLAHISHTFSDSSHTLHDDLASQVGEAVLHEHCPHPSEQQSQSAERRSVQKKCEKSGLEGWAYVPGIGFYPKDDLSLLERTRIERENIPRFLEECREQVARFIPIHEMSQSLQYEMVFDADWNWRFTAYLFEPGDLMRPGSVLIGHWAYLETRGFYYLDNLLFPDIESSLPPTQVSHFVNHHRIWLNGQQGFQTHLASIESHVSYTIVEGYLCFHTKATAIARGAMDFGDWIYYTDLGFFSKKHSRLGLVVRPGLSVSAEDVSAFIKANQEELENVPHFFTSLLPIVSRGLEVRVHSAASLYVKPVYTLLPVLKERAVQFFGDFVYLDQEGFCELPVGLRLPPPYEKPVVLSSHHLHHFLETELPGLKKFILHLDPALQQPLQNMLTVHYLARTAGGSLKAQFYYHTEFGKVAVTDLLEAIEHKRRYCFSEGGLIDTQSEPFQWIRHFKHAYQPDGKTIELSTMDFIRLDTTLRFMEPIEHSPTAQVTKTLLKELREFIVHKSPNLEGLKSELRLYQKTGLHWLWFLYMHSLSGLLCDDMGLGKTHQAMALIAATLNLEPKEKRSYLVVCPTSVIYHWQDKLQTFLPHLNVHTFHGLKRSLNARQRKGLILTSYGIFRLEQKLFETLEFDVAIFDEVQLAKNPNSRVHEALKKVKARTRIGLSGTPIENNLGELKALFDVVLPGYMPSEARYRAFFVNPIEREGNAEKKALLAQIIRPFVLRRRKREVLQELPEKSEDKSYCEMSPEQVRLYQETISQNQETLIANLRDVRAPINYVHIFSLLSRLKQICNHPSLVYKDPASYKKRASGKWDLFVELLDEAKESQQKVVVFSQYLYMLDIIEMHLKEKKWVYAQIRGDTLNRREELKRFQEDPSCTVFIGSLQAAGLGIDLTAASVVILYDRWWNAARENQAIDRVHRIGQKWGVQVYKLITKASIEEKIDKMITFKGRLLDEVVTADDQTLIKNFSRSELIELLSFRGSM